MKQCFVCSRCWTRRGSLDGRRCHVRKVVTSARVGSVLLTDKAPACCGVWVWRSVAMGTRLIKARRNLICTESMIGDRFDGPTRPSVFEADAPPPSIVRNVLWCYTMPYASDERRADPAGDDVSALCVVCLCLHERRFNTHRNTHRNAQSSNDMLHSCIHAFNLRSESIVLFLCLHGYAVRCLLARVGFSSTQYLCGCVSDDCMRSRVRAAGLQIISY